MHSEIDEADNHQTAHRLASYKSRATRRPWRGFTFEAAGYKKRIPIQQGTAPQFRASLAIASNFLPAM